MVDELLDKAPCGFASLAEDGSLLWANSTLARWLELTRKELQGRRFETLLSPGGRIFYQTYLIPLLKLNGHSEEIYLTLRSAKGDELPVLVNAVQRQVAGSIEYSLVFMQIRQRERYEEELLLARRAAEEANAQLAEANTRLKSLDRLKDELLAITSHDIGGLVTGIRLSSQMLLRQIHRQEQASDSNADRYVNSIVDSTERLVVLLRDLSDLALVNTGQLRLEFTRFLLSTVAQAAIEDLRVRADAKSITLSLDSPEGEPYIHADYNRLYQVISNLLGNSIKFTPDEGRVAVRILRQNGQVGLSIQDTGIGISAENIPELFAHFKNMSRPGTGGEPGSGLGLAIVRRLVELHGGEIKVESAEGSGSTFTITFTSEVA